MLGCFLPGRIDPGRSVPTKVGTYQGRQRVHTSASACRAIVATA